MSSSDPVQDTGRQLAACVVGEPRLSGWKVHLSARATASTIEVKEDRAVTRWSRWSLLQV
jgi:hypothetical protein